MSQITANSGFEKYALSNSGMDGGNLDAPLYICGIEFGGSFTTTTAFSPEPNVPCWSKEMRLKTLEKATAPGDRKNRFTMWPYCRMASKLTVSVLFDCIHDEKDLEREWRHHYCTDPELKGYCGRSGGNFSLNLYPIPFRRISDAKWHSSLTNTTGLQSRQQYRDWCERYRFPILRDLVRTHKPAAIICTSAIETRKDFASAFCDDRKIDWEAPFNTLPQRKTALPIFRLPSVSSETTLSIVPFLGQGGILSNENVLKLGRWIRADILARSPERLNGYWPPLCASL